MLLKTFMILWMYDMSAKVKGKYLEYLDKPGKQNTVINYDKFGKGQ